MQWSNMWMQSWIFGSRVAFLIQKLIDIYNFICNVLCAIEKSVCATCDHPMLPWIWCVHVFILASSNCNAQSAYRPVFIIVFLYLIFFFELFVDMIQMGRMHEIKTKHSLNTLENRWKWNKKQLIQVKIHIVVAWIMSYFIIDWNHNWHTLDSESLQ